MLSHHLRRFFAFSIVAVVLAIAVAGCGGGTTPQPAPPGGPVPFRTEVFLPNLSFPVTMAFAPDGRLFFNELSTGRVRIVEGGVLQAQPFAILPVQTDGERGLLGLAFDPQFASNRFVYVFYSDSSGVHRLVRFTEINGVGQNLTVLVGQLPSAQIHNGGNIGFGSDGKLYLTMGENGNPANSQDPNVLPGKILRYNSNGTVPTDNPFGATNPASRLACATASTSPFTRRPEQSTPARTALTAMTS